MGKSVAPRDEPAVVIEKRDGEEAPAVSKRDMASFDRALVFAEAALTKGPKVQLGTGEGGAGVGIIVDNNIQAAARVGTGAAKREVASPRVKVTTMYVRSGIPACEYQPLSSTCLTLCFIAGKKRHIKKETINKLVGFKQDTDTLPLFDEKPFKAVTH